MVRRDLERNASHVARFADELVFLPVSGRRPVGRRAFEDDFVAHPRHAPERAVCVDEVELVEALVHDLARTDHVTTGHQLSTTTLAVRALTAAMNQTGVSARTGVA